MDDTYQIYLNRVARMTLLETYHSQLQHIQESPKFKPQNEGGRKPVPFPGYTVMTPTREEDPQNEAFYKQLHASQDQLLKQLDPGLVVPVPPASFHLTLADLIWDGAYRDASANPDFHRHLGDRISESFEQCPRVPEGHQIRWQVLGLIVRTRAVAIGLVPKNELSYDQIVQFRRSIYQNQGLIGLGIEQQYHFTAHITLGYFGEIPPQLDRDRLSVTLSEFNYQWLETPQEMWVHRAELRKFEDMTNYHREPDWPVFKF